MVTGHDYEGVRAFFEGHDFNAEGLTFLGMQDYLSEHGYATAYKRRYRLGTFLREPWPPLPFAKVHFCRVILPTGAHFVVMLNGGAVLDPATPEQRRIEDYPRVEYVAAVCPLGAYA